MVKAVIFDFDGVILESPEIKSQAFAELFYDYPEKIKEIINYHLLNGGISRFKKFRYIYERILKKKYSPEKEAELGKRFSEIVVKKVMAAPFVPGAREFLKASQRRYRFFIVSGTPQEELRDIVRSRGLDSYFRGIYGSPREKVEIINGIIKEHNFSHEEVIYIGDSESDRIAAEKCGIAFIERNPHKKSAVKKNGPHISVKDLLPLEKILEGVEKPVLKRS